MENQGENIDIKVALENNFDILREKMNTVNKRIDNAITSISNQRLDWVKEELTKKISALEAKCSKDDDEIKQLKKGNILLDKIINEKKTVITSLELSIKHWLRRFEQVQIENSNLSDQCSLLQESQTKAKKELEDGQKEIAALQEEVKVLKLKLESNEQLKLYSNTQENKGFEQVKTSIIAQDNFLNVICTLSQVIGTINKELLQEKMEKERCMRNLEAKGIEVGILTQKLETVEREIEIKEKEALLLKAASQADTFTVVPNKNPFNISGSSTKDLLHTDNTLDYTESSTETYKRVLDLEKTIITTLKSDIISMNP